MMMLLSKHPARSVLPWIFRGIRKQHGESSFLIAPWSFEKRHGLHSCTGFWFQSGKIHCRNFSSHPSMTSDASEARPISSSRGCEKKATPWRFRQAMAIDEEVRVLFAGPHFHAALPSLQAELDRRRESRSQNNNTATKSSNQKIVLVHAPTTEELWNEAKHAHVAIPFMEAFPQKFFLPETTPLLRLVVQFGVGLEGVDVTEATRQGIAVSNVPAAGTGNAQATAEHAIYLAISLLRGFPTEDYISRFRNQSLGGLPIPRTIYQKRVTVVGYGAVGSCLARYLSVLGARVTVIRKSPWKAFEDEKGIHKAEFLDEVLPTTDVLFLACTLTPETRSLVNHSTIAILPKGALVVNIARGALVDHGAMLNALETGQIGGFASDVGIGHPTKPSEPWDPRDEICQLGPNSNVLFTPHVGGYSDASYSVMVQKIVDSIEHVVRGEAPPVWVNQPTTSGE